MCCNRPGTHGRFSAARAKTDRLSLAGSPEDHKDAKTQAWTHAYFRSQTGTASQAPRTPRYGAAWGGTLDPKLSTRSAVTRAGCRRRLVTFCYHRAGSGMRGFAGVGDAMPEARRPDPHPLQADLAGRRPRPGAPHRGPDECVFSRSGGVLSAIALGGPPSHVPARLAVRRR
jgi:hypothetical protein